MSPRTFEQEIYDELRALATEDREAALVSASPVSEAPRSLTTTLAPARPAPDRSNFAPAQALGRSPGYIEFIGSDSTTALPDAARLAGVALSVRADSAAMEGFSAFYQAGATLVQTPSGGRISVSLFDGRAPDAALSALSDSYADIAGSDLDPAGRSNRRMTLRYENAFDSPGGPEGLDVGVSPRAGVTS